MHKPVFPTEIVEQTTQYHFQQHHTRSRIIYLAVLLFIVAAFVSLWFVQVNVSVKGRGMLNALTERNLLKAPVSGRIENVKIKDNLFVEKGTVLFTIKTDLLEQQATYVNRQQSDIYRKTADLKKLTAWIGAGGLSSSPSLQTPLYFQQYQLFASKVEKAKLELKNTQLKHNRNKLLHGQQVISDAEFEKVQFALQMAESNLHLLFEQQGNQWQNDLTEFRRQLRSLSSQEGKFSREKEQYAVEAPVDGTIQQFSGIRAGSFVGVGETIAEISPDSGLVADIFVSPKDIGLIKEGMEVRLQVDAFNYNQWGMVTGKVADISNDVIIAQNNSPVFKVRCKLGQTALHLPNGYVGGLKKGMTLLARFTVTERTLFQLLYDNMDDWLDPSQNKL